MGIGSWWRSPGVRLHREPARAFLNEFLARADDDAARVIEACTMLVPCASGRLRAALLIADQPSAVSASVPGAGFAIAHGVPVGLLQRDRAKPGAVTLTLAAMSSANPDCDARRGHRDCTAAF